MSAVFKNFSRTLSTRWNNSEYKEAFAYPPCPPEASSGVQIATLREGEWLMVESDTPVFTTQVKGPSKYVVDIVKSRGHMCAQFMDGTLLRLEDSMTHVESVDNVEVVVLLTPSIYEVRYRSVIVRLVALVGKAKHGGIVLVGLNKERFAGAPEFEMVNLKSLWYPELRPEPRTSPHYSPAGGIEKGAVEDMTLSQMRGEWEETYEENYWEVEEDFFDEEKDVRFYLIWKRLNEEYPRPHPDRRYDEEVDSEGVGGLSEEEKSDPIADLKECDFGPMKKVTASSLRDAESKGLFNKSPDKENQTGHDIVKRAKMDFKVTLQVDKLKGGDEPFNPFLVFARGKQDKN